MLTTSNPNSASTGLDKGVSMLLPTPPSSAEPAVRCFRPFQHLLPTATEAGLFWTPSGYVFGAPSSPSPPSSDSIAQSLGSVHASLSASPTNSHFRPETPCASRSESSCSPEPLRSPNRNQRNRSPLEMAQKTAQTADTLLTNSLQQSQLHSLNSISQLPLLAYTNPSTAGTSPLSQSLSNSRHPLHPLSANPLQLSAAFSLGLLSQPSLGTPLPTARLTTTGPTLDDDEEEEDEDDEMISRDHALNLTASNRSLSASAPSTPQSTPFSLLTSSSILGSSIFPSTSHTAAPSMSTSVPSAPCSPPASSPPPLAPPERSHSLKSPLPNLNTRSAPYKPHKWLRPDANNSQSDARPQPFSASTSPSGSLSAPMSPLASSPSLNPLLACAQPTAGISSSAPPPQLELRLTRQPAKFHRARYMTEGSRGPIRDKSGKSFPAIRLIGFDEHPVPVYCYLSDDRHIAQPHLFYQASKLSSRCVTSCTELRLGGTNALQFELQPSQNMELTIDCLGIVKQRLFEIQQNAAHSGASGFSANASTGPNNANSGLERGAKSPCCRIVFECYLPKYNHILQTYSDTIHCKQVMRAPEVHRMSAGEAHVRGGSELFVIGKNFGKDARLLLRADGGAWQAHAWPEKELLHQTHLVARVPPFDSSLLHTRGECVGGQWRMTVELYVLCDGKRSAKQLFTYFE